MPRKPPTPNKRKYVVMLSVESPQRLTKARIKLLVTVGVEKELFEGTGEAGKARVRTVDFD